MDIKYQLFQQCEMIINARIDTIQERLSSLAESKKNETKSSAGDKFETGRAMLQIEEDKCKSQLAEANLVKMTLKSIPTNLDHDMIRMGHLVGTTNGEYFLSIGAGKIKIDDRTYFAVSAKSPIAKLLLGRKEKDNFVFNNKSIQINKIQ